MKNRKCSKCKKTERETEFYKTGGYCKNCSKDYQRKWIEENPEYHNECRKRWLLKKFGTTNYRETKYGDKLREIDKIYQANKRASGLVNKTTEYREWRKKHPGGANAQQLVNYAIKIGKLKRGVCKCGKENVYAHHDDYSKPFEIKWMCPSCHKKYHMKLGSTIS